MKRTMFLAILLWLSRSETASSQHFLSTKLGFMYCMPYPQISDLAKAMNRPTLIYMNSQNCSESKRFSREVLNMTSVTKLLRTKYVCMNANVDSTYGSAMARKYKKFVMPVIVLISPDGKLEYCCEINLDTASLISQVTSFYTACSLREEINLMVRTSSMKFNAACDKIASYYIDRYLRDNKSMAVEEFLRSQTLDLDFFNPYVKSFVGELDKKRALMTQTSKTSSPTSK